jgi:hypothetical protein
LICAPRRDYARNKFTKPVFINGRCWHERRDETRTHGCDAFGLMAVVYEEPPMEEDDPAIIRQPDE